MVGQIPQFEYTKKNGQKVDGHTVISPAEHSDGCALAVPRSFLPSCSTSFKPFAWISWNHASAQSPDNRCVGPKGSTSRIRRLDGHSVLSCRIFFLRDNSGFSSILLFQKDFSLCKILVIDARWMITTPKKLFFTTITATSTHYYGIYSTDKCTI
jgi:hypothetical protein